MTTQLLTDLTVADICDGFVYNELEGKGLFGWGGKLVIQPEYQRNYIYADGKRDVARLRKRRQVAALVGLEVAQRPHDVHYTITSHNPTTRTTLIPISSG